jgi:type VI secretion system protein ImpL
VLAARQALQRVPLVTLELERLLADAGRESPDLTLEGLVGAVPSMLSTGRVRSAFTQRAWEQRVRSRLESAFSNGEAWVLDQDAREDAERSRAELRTRYFQLYIQEWKNFLQSLSVQPPNGLDSMQAQLGSLTRGKPPALVKLFQALAANVQLERTPRQEEAEEGASEAGGQLLACGATLGPRDVEEAFAPLIAFTTEAPRSEDGEAHDEADGAAEPTALDFYQDQLALALDTVQGMKERPSESAALLEKLKATREGVAQLVRRYESDAPFLERLLLPPLQVLRSTVLSGMARTRSNDWCEAISKPFRQLMANRYPFVRESTQDASLAGLSEFLRPSGGTLRQFVQHHLDDAVIPSGRKWAFANVNARELYRDELLTFLEKSSTLATTLFPGDTGEPLVRFQVRLRAGTSPDAPPSELSSITLSLDGTGATYRNEPDNPWKPMLWPGQGGRPGAHLHVENASGATADLDEPGPWGLFRLLERVKRIEPSADGRFFTAVWDLEDLNGALVAIDFRPERTANPFFGLSGNDSSRLLRVFRDPGLMPPNGIAREGKGCIEAVSSNDAP